jgi:hypothetical protein
MRLTTHCTRLPFRSALTPLRYAPGAQSSTERKRVNAGLCAEKKKYIKMDKMKVKNKSLAKRCEICHQADLFTPEKELCSRCNQNNTANIFVKNKNNLFSTLLDLISGFSLFACIIIMPFITLPLYFKYIGKPISNLLLKYFGEIIGLSIGLFWGFLSIIFLTLFSAIIGFCLFAIIFWIIGYCYGEFKRLIKVC